MSEAYKPLDPETMPRSPGITYQELLDQDSRPVPDVLRLQSPKDMGLQRYSVKRYTSAAWHELEVERLWKKVWQFTCREEDIPEPGLPESFNVLIKELQSIALQVDLFRTSREEVCE